MRQIYILVVGEHILSQMVDFNEVELIQLILIYCKKLLSATEK